MPESIAVLMTCHNRRNLTLACLQNLLSQDLDAPLEVYLVDDGSSDGTAEAVRERFPQVHVIPGSGTLFWTGGVRLAHAHATQVEYDFHLWLNDDVRLMSGAVKELIACYRSLSARGLSRSIVVGAVKDPLTRTTTYGGFYRPNPRRPMRFELIEPSDEPVRCEVMNGNVVLIPDEVTRIVGNLDGAFTHGISDFDYALRAKRLGCTTWIAPGHVGLCDPNKGGWEKADGRWQLLRRLFSEKGLPLGEWLTFTRRHAGRTWPLFWVSPYVSRGARVLLGRAGASRGFSRFD